MNSRFRRKHLPRLTLVLAVVGVLALCACSSDEGMPPQQSTGTAPADVQTGLPRVVISTPNGQDITSKSLWTAGVRMTIYDTDGTASYDGTLSMKGRGNSTWGFPKKPFGLKLDKKSQLLGMARHKRWCLLANWVDRTMMRNEVAFEIARHMSSLAYTPQGRFVELFLNGTHMGNYYLCEQIKVDENRLDIAELEEGATAGPGITGGYLLEMDAHHDEALRFTSERGRLPWQCKDPDEMTEAQFNYIRSYVNDMERSLYDADRFARREFAQYMDLDTFADWWLVHELTMNTEPRFPYSCLVHKDRDSGGTAARLQAGPVWDFDFNTFIPAYSRQFATVGCLYYPRLFKDGDFRRLVKARWRQAKDSGLLADVCDCIDRTEQLLAASDKLNSAMWLTTNTVNGDTYLGFHDAVGRLKQAFIQKYYWLDNAIANL